MTEALQRFICLFFFCLPLLITACASTVTPVVWQAPDANWIYPEPPEKPRIKYLRSISGLIDLKGKQETKSTLLSWLGAEESEEYPLTSPYGVTADGDGRIWLTDPGVGLLYFLDIARQEIKYFSVLGGKAFSSPTGVAFDKLNDRLFVSDAGLGEVLVYDSRHNFILSLKPPQGFSRPGGVALDNEGNLFVADVLNGTIEVFSSAGRHLESVGSLINANGKFNHPSNISVDSKGNLYVIDSFNFRVEILDQDRKKSQIIGGLGDSAGNFARPRGITLDSEGHIYVSDAAFDNIQVFNQKGDLLLVFGRPGYGQDAFCLPAGITFDQHDRLYVADSCGHQVKVFKFLKH